MRQTLALLAAFGLGAFLALVVIDHKHDRALADAVRQLRADIAQRPCRGEEVR